MFLLILNSECSRCPQTSSFPYCVPIWVCHPCLKSSYNFSCQFISQSESSTQDFNKSISKWTGAGEGMDITLEAKNLDLGPLAPLTDWESRKSWPREVSVSHVHLQEILIVPAWGWTYSFLQCRTACLAMHLTSLWESAGVSEEVLNLSVRIYKASGLSVVSPTPLTLGENNCVWDSGSWIIFIANMIGPLHKHSPLFSCKQN